LTSLGANHSPPSHCLSRSCASFWVSWNGISAAGWMWRLKPGSATIGLPQNGQSAALTAGSQVNSAAQVWHLTVLASVSGASFASVARVARKSCSATGGASAASAIGFSKPQ
jgi:hypothetical protein